MKCHVCKGNMEKISGKMPIEKVEYEAYRCTQCGEKILNMEQLHDLANKYRTLRKAKQTSFAQWGNSLAIRIPEELVKELKIKPGTRAQITREKGILKIIPN